MDGGRQSVDLGWRTVGELLLTAFIAIEGWLLRRVWDSKPSREEVLKMFEDRDSKLLGTVSTQIERNAIQRDMLHRENVRQQELMRSEARECFKDVGERIDGIYELLAKPRGH